MYSGPPLQARKENISINPQQAIAKEEVGGESLTVTSHKISSDLAAKHRSY